jgi:hypothetical protein
MRLFVQLSRPLTKRDYRLVVRTESATFVRSAIGPRAICVGRRLRLMHLKVVLDISLPLTFRVPFQVRGEVTRPALG